jgi:two-component system, LytTR family, response regulator
MEKPVAREYKLSWQKVNEMKAIIVDDERNSCESLKVLLLEFCKDVEVADMCQTIAAAIVSIKKHRPDVVFLDINMKGENGFDLLDKVKPIDFEIVFATAYSEYAIRAFKFSAIDYLLKPIDVEELRSTIDKVRKAKRADAKQRYEQLRDNLKSPNDPSIKLALPSLEGLTFVTTSEIVYCQADSNYTTFYLADGAKIIVSQTLKEYEELLSPYRFFRIHHSYLINLDAIKQYVRGEGGHVVMSNDVRLDVSKRRKDEFLGLFKR